jgi:hypothetical protein
MLTGRVTNPSGRGAAGILMALVDDQNNVRYTMTNSFGYYRFPDVLTFKVYTVRVTPKKYSFATPERIVEVDESTGAINFVSTDN